jgi:hypothetical protein
MAPQPETALKNGAIQEKPHIRRQSTPALDRAADADIENHRTPPSAELLQMI